jgi:polyribonucleotide nucleotidyltransferase
MDAGVHDQEAGRGHLLRLVTEGGRWMTMVDIQGLEDFFGDMDFKVPVPRTASPRFRWTLNATA